MRDPGTSSWPRVELRPTTPGGAVVAGAWVGDPAGGIAGGLVAMEAGCLGLQGLRWLAWEARDMARKHAVADLPVAGGARLAIYGPERGSRDELVRTVAGMLEDLEVSCGLPADLDGGLCAGLEQASSRVRSGGGEGAAASTAAGMIAALEELAAAGLAGPQTLAGMRVAVQGLGRLGLELTVRLVAAGARVVAADTDPAACERARTLVRARQADLALVEPGAILALPVDVVCPCARGGVVDDELVEVIQARLLHPGATCALAAGSDEGQRRLARRLHARGIFHLPDWVVACGGVHHMALQAGGVVDRFEVESRVSGRMRAVIRWILSHRGSDETGLEVASRLFMAGQPGRIPRY